MKIQQIKGRLLQFFGEWKIQSEYGTYPLSKELQSKPDVSCNGEWVSGIVSNGLVIDYHFSDNFIDKKDSNL